MRVATSKSCVLIASAVGIVSVRSNIAMFTVRRLSSPPEEFDSRFPWERS